MAAHLSNHGLGYSINEPNPEQMLRALEELDPNDVEHGAAAVSDDLGNILEWDVEGRLVYWNESRASSRHMIGVSKAKVVELWILLVQGAFGQLEKELWQPRALSADDASRYAMESAKMQLAADREFYALLGTERPDVRCRGADCARGAILQSVFCRVHHFEQGMRRPCPFSE